MLRMKQLIAISVVILFIGLSFSTTTAKVNIKDKLEFGIIGEDGKVFIQKFKQNMRARAQSLLFLARSQ